MESKTTKEIIKDIKNCHSGVEITASEDVILNNLLHVKIEWKDEHGNIIKGFASDTNPDMAIVKAYSEFIERFAYDQYSKINKNVKSSNGFAAHTDILLAKENSLKELIERDSFLMSWIGYHSPHWPSDAEMKNIGANTILEYRPYFKIHGFDFKIGIIGITNNAYYTVIGALISDKDSSVISTPKIGLAIDTSTNKNILSAITSVFHGVSYYASLIINRDNANLPIFNNINIADIQAPYDHLEFYLNPQSIQNIDWFFTESKNVLSLDLPEVTIDTIPLTIDTAIPLVVTRAYSNEMQDYFVGQSNLNKLNSERINKIIKNMNSINLTMHPLP